LHSSNDAALCQHEQPPEAAETEVQGATSTFCPANPKLSAYFRSLAMCDAPPLPAIMEANFCHSLPLDAFAKMCHRSLSSFKREFRRCYGTTPGKWLIGRRLECAAQMLRTTSMSMTEIALECGFEEPSHFSAPSRRSSACPTIIANRMQEAAAELLTLK
jgi:AraC-like DNA-binding protein